MSKSASLWNHSFQICSRPSRDHWSIQSCCHKQPERCLHWNLWSLYFRSVCGRQITACWKYAALPVVLGFILYLFFQKCMFVSTCECWSHFSASGRSSTSLLVFFTALPVCYVLLLSDTHHYIAVIIIYFVRNKQHCSLMCLKLPSGRT